MQTIRCCNVSPGHEHLLPRTLPRSVARLALRVLNYVAAVAVGAVGGAIVAVAFWTLFALPTGAWPVLLVLAGVLVVAGIVLLRRPR